MAPADALMRDPVWLIFCRTGFSREEASVNTIDFRCETRRIPG